MTTAMPRISNHVAPRGLVAIARHYIGDVVYGANDGLVTTFAAVAGVEGGALSPAAVLIVGIANLAADGLSMGIGNYLALRTREHAREADNLPEEESEPRVTASRPFWRSWWRGRFHCCPMRQPCLHHLADGVRLR